jgi:hypothetical protein
MNNYRSQSLILDYVIRITNNARIAACGGRNFWQNEGDGASHFTALITDMAMVSCFVWRATRHVSDDTL